MSYELRLESDPKQREECVKSNIQYAQSQSSTLTEMRHLFALLASPSLLICKSKTYLSLSLPSVCSAVVLQAFWHAHQQYLSTTKARLQRRGMEMGVLATKAYLQRGSPLPICASAEVDQCHQLH